MNLAPAEAPLIRGPRHTDQGYIASTWCKQMTDRYRHNRTEQHQHRVRVGLLLDRVFDRADTRALVRVTPGDSDRILGWVVYVHGAGVPVVHFCYVRKEERGKGHGAEILRAVGVEPSTSCVYTCIGPSTARMLHTYRAATHLPLEEFLT